MVIEGARENEMRDVHRLDPVLLVNDRFVLRVARFGPPFRLALRDELLRLFRRLREMEPADQFRFVILKRRQSDKSVRRAELEKLVQRLAPSLSFCGKRPSGFCSQLWTDGSRQIW